MNYDFKMAALMISGREGSTAPFCDREEAAAQSVERRLSSGTRSVASIPRSGAMASGLGPRCDKFGFLLLIKEYVA
jgi:hypothetical protein